MPTLTLQPDATDGLDAHMRSESPTTNYGTASGIPVGELNSGSVWTRRSVIKFDLSSIPSSSTVDDATLSLWLRAKLADSNNTANLYRCRRAWVEAEVTWNIWSTGNSWTTAGADDTTNDRESDTIGSQLLQTTDALETKYDITLTTSKVQDWVDGGFTNNGIVMRGATETNDMYSLHSSDSGTASERPKLVVNYTLAGGGVTLSRRRRR